MYIKKNHLDNFLHMQIPRKIWKMFLDKKITPASFKIYVEFFDRLKLSAYNNWIDSDGNVYIKYSYEELMEILNLKSKGTIAEALNELRNLELIVQEKGFNTSSKFYLSNILENMQSSKKTNSSSTVFRTPEVHFSELQKSEKVDANHNNINHNNFNNNNNSNNTAADVVDVDEISLFLEKNNLNTKAITGAIEKYNYSFEYIKTQLEIANKLKALGRINNAQGCFSTALTKNIALTLPVEKKENNIKPSTKELGAKEKEIIKNNIQAKNKYDEGAELRESYDRYFDTLTEEEREYIEEKSYNLAVEKYGGCGVKSLIDTMARTETKYIILEKYINKELAG